MTAVEPEVRPRQRYGRAVVLAGCGLALAGIAVLALTRFFGLDSGTYLALPISFLPYALIGTLIVLAVLLAAKAKWLVLAAAALAVLQLAWLVPRFVPDGTDVPADAPRLRVGASNTYVGKADPKALVALVRAARLDVFAAVELTVAEARALDAAGMRELMPYREAHPEIDASIYSRLPLSGGGLLDRPTTWPQTTATVRLGGRTIRLIAVHTFYPPGGPAKWTRDFAALRAETGKDVVILGDFNATLDHAPMRALLTAGMIDTHAELGRGWAPTWPAARLPVPLIQIDHILHGPGLAAVSASEHAVPGSDHRAVVAELALRG